METTVDAYGVRVTPLQEMQLMKYLNNKSISMNTKTPAERKQIVWDFIEQSEDRDAERDQPVTYGGYQNY